MRNYKYVLGIDDITICKKTWFLSRVKSNGHKVWDNDHPIVFETEEDAKQFAKDHDLQLVDYNQPITDTNNSCRKLDIFLYFGGR